MSARERAAAVRRLRAEPPLDALTSRIAQLASPVDGFAVEALASYVLEVVGTRGPDAPEVLARFSHAAVSDPRAGTTALGLQAMSVLALHGHRDVRDEARSLVDSAPADLAAQLPAWISTVGQVRIVETGVIRRVDGSETVLHLLLDHIDAAAGPRHLLSLAVEHGARRVHLLDVRVRANDDVLAPMAERYAESADPVWAWGSADDVLAAADPALSTTAARTPEEWPVLGVEGIATTTWTLGAQRLAHVTGTALL